jgi:hypothetical protein
MHGHRKTKNNNHIVAVLTVSKDFSHENKFMASTHYVVFIGQGNRKMQGDR